jgi:rSAM/selenodomain-associated transferase 2
VVIPTLHESSSILALIASLRDFHQVIVSDGRSEDGTAELAEAAGARVVRAARGRGTQLNAGADCADGEILLFLHADTLLPPRAASLIRAALEDASVVGGCFRLQFDSPGLLLRLYAWFSRFDTRWSTFGDQAFFVRRTGFDAAGGFPAQPLMEDVELRIRLKRIGRFIKLPESVTTSARRFEKDGAVRRQLHNALLLAAHAFGVDPQRLARWYR